MAASQISQLAVAYREGARDRLEELHRALRPSIARFLARYRKTSGLPSVLDADDLDQQSWIILAELADRWRPEEGDFLPYFLVSFPWELERYVQGQSPGRYSRTLSVCSVSHDDVLQVREQADTVLVDPDMWVLLNEALRGLTSQERSVLTIRLLERQSYEQVALQLGVRRSSVYRLYRSALRKLRIAIDDAGTDRRLEFVRVVRVLHGIAGPKGKLPGRKVVCARTGLSAPRYRQLLDWLAVAGCVVRPGPRHRVRLVYTTPEETLGRLSAVSLGSRSTSSALVPLEG